MAAAQQLLAAVDVHYFDPRAAHAALVAATDPAFAEVVAEHSALVEDVVPYQSGESARPLYVTAAGMPRAEAARMVSEMAGRFRLPDALRRVDALARQVQ